MREGVSRQFLALYLPIPALKGTTNDPGHDVSDIHSLPRFISLVGIVSGLIVAYGLLAGETARHLDRDLSNIHRLTSVTGFLFPFTHLLPSHMVGIISLVVLAFAILARYAFT